MYGNQVKLAQKINLSLQTIFSVLVAINPSSYILMKIYSKFLS